MIFDSPNDGAVRKLALPDAQVTWYPDFFSRAESDALFETLNRETVWRQESMKWYGKTVNMPRLTAYYGDPGTFYTYSGVTAVAEGWTPTLLAIKRRSETVAEVAFNYVILQLYRNERDSVSWHSDAEPALGRNPVIGSVSFGATRIFQLKHRQHPAQRAQIALEHGSLLVMAGPTQHYWRHQLPKVTTPCGARINLTFRVIRR